MADLAYPSGLQPAAWEKSKSAFPPAEHRSVADALKSLLKLHGELDPKAFDTAGLASVEAVERRLEQFDAEVKRRIKPLTDQSRALVATARKLEADLKKASPPSKPALAATAALAKCAAEFADELASGVAPLRARLVALQGKLEAERKKAAAAPAEEAPEHKLVRTKVIAGMLAVKTARPGTPPMQFMVAASSASCTAYLALSVGASTKILLAKLMPGESGIKYHQGECRFEDGFHTFVGEDVPTGLAKRLQKGLTDLTGQRYKVRARRPDGPAEDADADEAVEAASGRADATPPSGASKAAAPASPAAAAFEVRLKELLPRIKQVGNDPAGQAVRLKASEAATLARKGSFAPAQKLLEEIAGLLAGGAGSDDFAAAWSAAKTAWLGASGAVDAQIAKLQAALRADADEELQAIGKFGLNGVTGDFKVPLLAALREVDAARGDARRAAGQKARQVVAGFRRHLDTDEGVAVCEDNPFDIPVTLRGTLGPALARLDAALATLR